MTRQELQVSAESAFNQSTSSALPVKTRREKFTEVYRQNTWKGIDSVSGTGSDLQQTALIRRELPVLLRQLGARSLVDAPCGDLNWIRHVDLGVEYIGVDIVEELVASLRRNHPDRRFECVDLVTEILPRAHVILCRDCLVHLPLEEVRRALGNFAQSGAKWLLTTTFPATGTNQEVRWSGWRPLDLQAPPFNLPTPARLIVEGCTEDGGKYADKSLGLWRIADLPRF